VQREPLAGNDGAAAGKTGPFQAKEQKGGSQGRTIREKERKFAIRVNSLAEVAQACPDVRRTDKAATIRIPANFG